MLRQKKYTFSGITNILNYNIDTAIDENDLHGDILEKGIKLFFKEHHHPTPLIFPNTLAMMSQLYYTYIVTLLSYKFLDTSTTITSVQPQV